jgi:hypothetical protein
MVKVYHAMVWDGGEHSITPYKGTFEWIAMIRGAALTESAEEVPESSLDGQGRYLPAQGNGSRPGRSHGANLLARLAGKLISNR